jgi:hypothetical protein
MANEVKIHDHETVLSDEPKSSLELVKEGLLHLATLRAEGKLPARYHDVPETLAGRLAVISVASRINSEDL